MPINIKDDEVLVKMAHIHMTLRRNNLVCMGRGDDLEQADQVYSDEQVLKILPDLVNARIMKYRDRINENEKYIVCFFPKRKGKSILFIMCDPAAKLTVQHEMESLDVREEKDHTIEELFLKLRRGESDDG